MGTLQGQISRCSLTVWGRNKSMTIHSWDFLIQFPVLPGTIDSSVEVKEVLYFFSRFSNQHLRCLHLILHKMCVCGTVRRCIFEFVCVLVFFSPPKKVFTVAMERKNYGGHYGHEQILNGSWWDYSLARNKTHKKDELKSNRCWVSQAASGGWQWNNLSTVLHNNLYNIAVFWCHILWQFSFDIHKAMNLVWMKINPPSLHTFVSIFCLTSLIWMPCKRISLFTLGSEIVCSFRVEQLQRLETHLVLLGAFLFDMHDESIIIQIRLPQQAATQLTSFHICAFISINVTHHLYSIHVFFP